MKINLKFKCIKIPSKGKFDMYSVYEGYEAYETYEGYEAYEG